MAPSLTLYHDAPTRSTRALWTIYELDLPVTIIPKQFKFNSPQDVLQAEEYKAVNPLSQLPALTDGNVTIFESGAIVEFLLARYGKGKLAPAPGTDEHAYYLQWLWFAEGSLCVWATEIAQHAAIKPEAERIPQILPSYQAKVLKALAVVEKQLEKGDYILGADFSAADIILGQALVICGLIGLLPSDDFPNIAAYDARLKARPAYRKAFGLKD